jgi:hypothetical protein
MNRTVTALLISGSLAAFPALAQKGSTKIQSNTNPAGSRTMVMTKSGQGANKTMSKTMTNTEGNKVLTSSRTVTRAKSKRAKSNVQLAKLHKNHKQKGR